MKNKIGWIIVLVFMVVLAGIWYLQVGRIKSEYVEKDEILVSKEIEFTKQIPLLEIASGKFRAEILFEQAEKQWNARDEFYYSVATTEARYYLSLAIYYQNQEIIELLKGRELNPRRRLLKDKK